MFRLILTSVLALLATDAAAVRPVTFADVCAGYTISKRGDDILIRCPGEPREAPWMTIKDCKNPVAKRNGPNLTITCDYKPPGH